MTATSSARRANTVAPSRKDWPCCTPGSQSQDWAVLRAGGRAVGHAEHLDAQLTLDTFHMWEKSQVSPSSPTDQPAVVPAPTWCCPSALLASLLARPGLWAWKVRGRDYLHRVLVFFLKKLYTFATFSPGLHKNHFMKQPRLNSLDAPSPAPSCLDLITKRGEAKPCRVEVGKKSKAGSSDCCPHASNGQAASLTFLGREC